MDKKNHFFLLLLSIILLFSFFVSSCDDTDSPDKPTPIIESSAKGIYVLNEGLYNMNNSSLCYYDFESGKLTEDIFRKVNNRGLGDTGSDLKIYGSKLYCVVNLSEQLEIMNVSDCKSIKQISLQGKQPRKITFYQNKAYICCYNGEVIQLDTASLKIETIVRAGKNPEGVCVANHKLYVTNSGGLDYPNYDNTVSVFSLPALTLTKTIEVAINPSIIQADEDGNLYLVSQGDYGATPCTFQKIDSETDEVVHDYELPILNFAISHDNDYVYYYNFNTDDSWIRELDLVSGNIIKENFIVDGTSIETPYSITVNSTNGDIYITDVYNYTVNGEVYCFNQYGRKKFSFEAGLNPSVIAIRN